MHFNDAPLITLLKSLKRMVVLREFHFINIPELEKRMRVLSKSLVKHKTLELLDIRQEHMRTRDISSLVEVLSQRETALKKVNISKAIISQQNMAHLWVALHYNISVTELIYSRINFLAVLNIRAVDAELIINNTIRDSILPIVEKVRKEKKHAAADELCLREVDIPKAFFPAVVKYIKLQRWVM